MILGSSSYLPLCKCNGSKNGEARSVKKDVSELDTSVGCKAEGKSTAVTL